MTTEAPRNGELSSLRVLAHPLRLRILSLLTGAALSATELARELGVSQALASYHLRQLHRAGVIELGEVRPRRGGRERRFVYRPDAAATPPPAPADGLALFAEAVAVELRRRSQQAEAVEAMRAASLTLHRQAQPPRTAGTIRVSVSAVLFPMATDAPAPS